MIGAMVGLAITHRVIVVGTVTTAVNHLAAIIHAPIRQAFMMIVDIAADTTKCEAARYYRAR